MRGIIQKGIAGLRLKSLDPVSKFQTQLGGGVEHGVHRAWDSPRQDNRPHPHKYYPLQSFLSIPTKQF